ncbi:hypothetical protein GOODEAATRI_015719 [Goodea atripinnis]|uniref:Transmembrane protein n=1 Tax=Goodea atripinnis TaxID=208336 RepID=A0ABV0MJ63_9TELE
MGRGVPQKTGRQQCSSKGLILWNNSPMGNTTGHQDDLDRQSRWRRRRQPRSFALSLFVYFVCLYVFRATVLWSRATILWSHSAEELLNIRESSLGFFSTIFHQSELHRTPDEQSRSTLRDTPPKASEGKARFRW